MKLHRCLPLALSIVVVSSLAAHSAAAELFSASLFDGKTLDNWIVTDCDVGVENGSLVLKKGEGLVRSHHRYGDFVLELDWKARKADFWDSGIYIRAELPTKGKWPSRYQINLKTAQEGNLTTIKSAASTGLVKPGEWNHFKVTVVGHTAKLEINGKPAWETDQIEPLTGCIGFQSEVTLGGQFEFKNIRITELDHASLFNGRDLSGWEGAGGDVAACWKIDDGAIMCTGAKGPWLRSAKEYGDFNLRFEYKLQDGGNTGIFVRVPADGKRHADGDGIEVQVLDDNSEKHKNILPGQFGGSVYKVIPAEPHVGRPVGEWNTMEINCRGSHYRVTHNGMVVADGDGEKYPALAKRRMSGFLGLQNHSEPVWFRAIRVGNAY